MDIVSFIDYFGTDQVRVKVEGRGMLDEYCWCGSVGELRILPQEHELHRLELRKVYVRGGRLHILTDSLCDDVPDDLKEKTAKMQAEIAGFGEEPGTVFVIKSE